MRTTVYLMRCLTEELGFAAASEDVRAAAVHRSIAVAYTRLVERAQLRDR